MARHKVPAFQSTPPARAATLLVATKPQILLFQSTPPARAATSRPPERVGLLRVSIHAAREGGDGERPVSPREQIMFQSTPPARAATISPVVVHPGSEVSIHAAREGGDDPVHAGQADGDVSIHAAREGGDRPAPNLLKGKRLSTRFRAPRRQLHRYGTYTRSRSHKPSVSKLIPIARTSRHFPACFRSARHMISGPCGSYDTFAPTCSTRRCQLSPRK